MAFGSTLGTSSSEAAPTPPDDDPYSVLPLPLVLAAARPPASAAASPPSSGAASMVSASGASFDAGYVAGLAAAAELLAQQQGEQHHQKQVLHAWLGAGTPAPTPDAAAAAAAAVGCAGADEEAELNELLALMGCDCAATRCWHRMHASNARARLLDCLRPSPPPTLAAPCTSAIAHVLHQQWLHLYSAHVHPGALTVSSIYTQSPLGPKTRALGGGSHASCCRFCRLLVVLVEHVPATRGVGGGWVGSG